jgi:nicotinamide riboside kinase
MNTPSTRIIAITGPESTGKSTLVRELTNLLPNAHSVEEYARLYLEKKGLLVAKNVDEILHMMETQLSMVAQALNNKPGVLFLDTDDVMYKIWIQEVFDVLPNRWHDLHLKFPIDFTLLCMPDLPWQADPLRVNPHDRERLAIRYREELNQLNRPFKAIEGNGQMRLKSACHALEKLGIKFPI